MNFSAISLHGVQTGWTNYSIWNHSVNILGPKSANESSLGDISVSVEKYTMIRLYIQNVTVTVDGINDTLRVASTYASINYPFNVSGNGTVKVQIQFDLNQDVNVHGKSFTPLGRVGITDLILYFKNAGIGV